MSRNRPPQRVNIRLDQTEAEALIRLSKTTLRHPREQARLLLRLELMRLGYLPAEENGILPPEFVDQGRPNQSNAKNSTRGPIRKVYRDPD